VPVTRLPASVSGPNSCCPTPHSAPNSIDEDRFLDTQRALAEFGDDPNRYPSAKARKNYAGTSPITRASGKSRTVQSRYIRNNRLADALQHQAFAALRVSPGARRSYDTQRDREAGDNPALRQVGNRLVGVLHGCLKTHTLYDEATAWPHHAHTHAA
jgi:hypothetical protein